MKSLIFRRLIQSLIVVLIVSFLVFVALRFLPGDPILLYITSDQLADTPVEKIQSLRKEYGLDKPVLVQYVIWLSDTLMGDLGQSISYQAPVKEEILRRLPITLHIGALALFLSTILGIPAGLLSALRRGEKIDTAVTIIANIGITVPVFWLGILLIYLFGLKLGWLPVFGYSSPLKNFWLSMRQTIMPVFCLMIFSLASTVRQTRSSMLEVIQQDYIRTARAKGLRERIIIYRHILKNGLIPVVTLIGVNTRLIFGGSVLIETVFNIPGMGRLGVEGILNQDYAIVQGVTLVIALVVTMTNLLVDISYGWLDPRIRYS